MQYILPKGFIAVDGCSLTVRSSIVQNDKPARGRPATVQVPWSGIKAAGELAVWLASMLIPLNNQCDRRLIQMLAARLAYVLLVPMHAGGGGRRELVQRLPDPRDAANDGVGRQGPRRHCQPRD